MLVAEKIGQLMSEATGHHIEAMVYGDGAFKDPAGKIWELADPVVAPGYTKGLIGTPNELKLKYLADHDFGDLSGTALQEAIVSRRRTPPAWWAIWSPRAQPPVTLPISLAPCAT